MPLTKHPTLPSLTPQVPSEDIYALAGGHNTRKVRDRGTKGQVWVGGHGNTIQGQTKLEASHGMEP